MSHPSKTENPSSLARMYQAMDDVLQKCGLTPLNLQPPPDDDDAT